MSEEGDVQRQILEYLTLRKIWCRRYSNRAIRVAGRLIFPIRKPDNKPDNGHPDIIARTRNATINIECKAKTGVQGEAQKAWQKEAEARGEIYILARSLDDVMILFEWMASQVTSKLEAKHA